MPVYVSRMDGSNGSNGLNGPDGSNGVSVADENDPQDGSVKSHADEHGSEFGDPGPLARLEEFVARPNAMGEVVQRVTDGQQLKDIAKSLRIPYGRLAEWVTDDADRHAKYLRASAIWIDGLAREVVDIADGLDVENVTKGDATAAKVRIDTRLRLASKLDRATYGDRVAVDANVRDDRPQTDRDQLLLETARTIAFTLRRADEIQRAVDARAEKVLPAPNNEPIETEYTSATEPAEPVVQVHPDVPDVDDHEDDPI